MTFVLASAPLSPVSAQRESATEFLLAHRAEALRLVTESSSDPDELQRRARDAARVMAGVMDFDDVAQRALGSRLDARTREERRRVAALLRARFERSYASWGVRSVAYEIVGTAETPSARGVDVVLTWSLRGARDEGGGRVVYAMRRVGDRWFIDDVRVGGSSLVERLATRCAAVLERDGWEGLLRWLEAPEAR